jgi:hypothetical protein
LNAFTKDIPTTPMDQANKNLTKTFAAGSKRIIRKSDLIGLGLALLHCFRCGKLQATKYYYLEAVKRRPDCCGIKMWATCPSPFPKNNATFN